MRQFRIVLAAFATLLIAGCGGDTIKSPDFESVLTAVRVAPQSASVPAGRTFQFSAVGESTLPPGSATPTQSGPLENVVWTSSNEAVATIDANGLATGLSLGTTQIRASSGGLTSAPATLTVGGAVLEAIEIQPNNPVVPLGNTVALNAIGTFSDGDTNPVSVNWNSGTPATVTVAPASGPSTTATGVAEGASLVTGSTTNAEGELIQGSTTVTVGPFQGELISLEVSPDPASQPLGRPQQFVVTGTFTAAPGSGSTTVTRAVTSGVVWSVADNTVAGIDANNGIAIGIKVGTTLVTATVGGVSDSATFSVTPPVLDRIEINPMNPTIPLGGEIDLFATGILTNGASSPISVNWSSSNVAVATVDAGPGSTTTASALSLGTTTITASDPDVNSDITATTVLTVGDAVVNQLLRVEPDPARVTIGRRQQFRAVASVSDSSEINLPNSDVTWSSSDTNIATVDANGIATGVALGAVDITAARNGTSESAAARLTVTGEVCTTPLRASDGVVLTDAQSPLCVGCSLDDGGNITNASIADFGRLITPVGLLGANNSVRLRAVDNGNYTVPFPGGSNAGFIIGRPAGELLLAEVVSQVQVRTLLNGVVQEDSSDGVALRVDLLGAQLLGGGGDDQSDVALVSISTSTAYDAIELSFNSGVASALSVLQVFQACGTAETPQSAAALVGIDRIEPPESTVSVGASRGLVAIGNFANGNEAPIPDADLDWSSATPAVASVDVNGLVTGNGPGTATITAALKSEVVASGNRTAVATVQVVQEVCSVPFAAANGATIDSDVFGVCLFCSATNLPNVIDPVTTNSAGLSVPIGLLGAGVNVTVSNSPSANDFTAGTPGFLISEPTGKVLQAEVLSQITVQTLLNGVVQQGSDELDLQVDLLGIPVTGEDDEISLVTVNATLPYDALRLTFSSGVLSLGLQNQLENVKVFQACANTNRP